MLEREIDHIADVSKKVERTAETAQDVKDGDLNWAIPSVLSNLVPVDVVAGILQNQLSLEESRRCTLRGNESRIAEGE